MLEFILMLLNNKQVLIWQSIIGGVVDIVLIYLFFQKNGRDERGRAIIGKASIISMIYFMVIATAIAQAIGSILPADQFNAFAYPNIIQFIFDSVVSVEIIAILVYRKIQ